jgi:hypothetical protein
MKRVFWMLAMGAVLSAAMAVGLSRAEEKAATTVPVKGKSAR